MMKLLRKLIWWHGTTRAPLSTALAKFSRLYMLAWSNACVEIQVNGERWLLETVGRTLHRDGDCYFDVGANVGDWSKTVLETCRSATLFAFEPVPDVFSCLIANVSAVNFRPHCFALSDRNGPQTINFIRSNPHLSSLETAGRNVSESGDEITIECRTGDVFCEEQNVQHIRLLKVDTEGHDLKVLSGFSQMLARGAIDIVQFEHNQMSLYSRTLLKDFYDLLESSYEIGRLLRSGIEFSPYTVQNENFAQANFIAIRKDLLTNTAIARLRRSHLPF